MAATTSTTITAPRSTTTHRASRRAEPARRTGQPDESIPARRLGRQCLHLGLLCRTHRDDAPVHWLAKLCAGQYEHALSARLDAAQAAQCRADRRRLADPAEGQYPGAPKTPRALIGWLRSREIAGEWSRFTGYFAPHKAAYDLPEMKDICNSTPTRRSPRPAAIRRPLVRNLQPRSRAQGDRGPGPGNP